MAESYSNYLGRLRSRHKLGKAADKLVCITDKYLPKITDETCAFIMRFPYRIPQLLKQACQVRKKAKARLARGGRTTFSGRVKPPKPENQTGRTSRRATSTSKTAPTAKDLREATDEGEPASVQSLARSSQPPRTTRRTRPRTHGTDTPAASWGRLPTTTYNLYFRTSRLTWTGGGRTARYAQTVAPQPVHRRGRCHAPRMGAMQPRTPSRKLRRQASLGAQRPRTPSRSPQRQPVA